MGTGCTPHSHSGLQAEGGSTIFHRWLSWLLWTLRSSQQIEIERMQIYLEGLYGPSLKVACVTSAHITLAVPSCMASTNPGGG